MNRVVHRPARVSTPLVRPEAEQLAPPPQLPEGPSGGIPLQSLLPVVGAISSVVMMVVLRGNNPVLMVVAALVFVVALVGGLGMAFTQRGNAVRNRRTQRERYLDYLEELRGDLRSRTTTLRERAEHVDPSPETLPRLVGDPARLWERRRSHGDFLRVRVGSGDVGWLDLAVPPDQNPVQPLDPLMLAELEQVAEHYGTVHAMPIAVRLDGAGDVSVVGDRDAVLEVARALVVQLAALHAPEDLHLAAAFPAARADDWDWFDLLPHARMDRTFDGPLRARRVAEDVQALARTLSGELGERARTAAMYRRSGDSAKRSDLPRLVVFADEHGTVAVPLALPEGETRPEDLRITVVHLVADRLHEPSDVRVRVTARSDAAVVGGDTGAGSGARTTLLEIVDARDVEEGEPAPVQLAVCDPVAPPLVTAVARALAPLRLSADTEQRAESSAAIGVSELLGVDDVATIDPDRAWRPRAPRDFLRVPIGVDDFGAPLLLDLKESAQLGMGPHGICIGATGSGKSEMLRTLVLGLAVSHPPEDLAMILVDYKGGAAFAPFARLPHVAGLIDNLADDPQLTRRARASIAGEVRRRQEMLRDAGSAPSITHYRELRTRRPDLPPMPHLVLVIDEFGELLTAEPEFVDLLLMIGRIGRSIGVHLLLSSQRIEAGKLRGLDTYLSYRLGLRTFSEAESQVVLDTGDAFHLPAVPGYGYLKVDTSVYTRFRSGYVSGPVEDAAPASAVTTSSADTAPEPFELPVYNTLAAEDDAPGEVTLEAPDVGRSVVDEAVERLDRGDRDTTPVWLPPLPTRLALGAVLDPNAVSDPTGVTVPIGLLDDPARQRQRPWMLDLTRGGGHIAVIGAPGSGRTTFLRTVAASIALTTTPRQVSVYGMDLAGGGLGRIEGFPHVGGVATRADRNRLLRLVEELQAMIRLRERVFRDYGIDSLAMLRTRHAAGRVPELGSADVVLLVDGFGVMRTEFEELEDAFGDLLQRGGSFGIHVVLGLTRWNELRLASQPLIGQRFELRLNDPADSTIARAAAATLKSGEPGRVLTDGELFGQVALPVLDDVEDGVVGDELGALAQRVADSWGGPAAAPIRLLPESFDPAELPDPLDTPTAVPFALRQDTMDFVAFDPAVDQHLLVFGDTASGKTALLRGLAAGFMERSTPDELVLAFMDVRGGAAAGTPDDFLGGHAANGKDARGLAAAIAAELEQRSAGPATGPRPRIVVLVDDYDIVASAGTDPLAPLMPYLPSARDLGLHVVLTRPVAGAARAMYDTVIQSIRDSGATGLVLSGERSEGQVFPKVYAEQFPPGRGRLVRRGTAPRIVQVAHFPSATAAAPAQADPAGQTTVLDPKGAVDAP
ncbi:type VII secretion protein EccCa [Curtobacterium aurantiacum]|uniref:Type VII secretion protein EccCa n=1 Tax=Curtobacterium aurantiacum TaxID=3236919 RepID=A0ABS5VC50_9MICO|nr:type VII secretion protein EccCa [Curtobacterium flaccumfaciens]MBT1543801.1 type VII secretion protein EccCa [Curtobacterium flaccumfaciens pv. flaccumfaciens]MBT1586554.1 type VII secretion protein EccCa [Curtobacterium flaccumfaciens pv. flaccumfaciens]